MGRPKRNIDRLVFSEQFDVIIDRHFRGTGHHHPVFSPVMMHLHGQSLTGFNGNSLHLVTVSGINGVILAPRTVNFTVNMVFMSSVSFNLLHHFFDVLHRVAIGDQHRIFGLHHHQILHPDGRHQARFGIHVAVLRFVANDVAMMHIAFSSMGADFPQR